MTIRHCPSLQLDDLSWVYLPTLDLSIDPGWIMDYATAPVDLPDPGAPGFIWTSNQAIGARFDFSGFYQFGSVGDALLFRQTMDAWLHDDQGRARELVFCDWTDSDGIIKRTWKGCKATEKIRFPAGPATSFGEYSFTLETPYASPAAFAPDGTAPGQTTWPAWGGTYSSTPEVIYVAGNTPYNETVILPGFAAVTAAGNLGSMRRALRFQRAMTIRGIYISGATPDPKGTSGNTIIVVSTHDYTAPPPAGTYISSTLAYNASASSAIATGTISLPANTPIYVYVTQSARHQNVEIKIEAQAQ